MSTIDTTIQPLQKLYQWEKEKANEIALHQPIPNSSLTYTWQQFGEQVRRMAAALKAMDLPEKSHVALISKNCAHWFMADLAIMMAGHISVPLYPNTNAETLRYILEHSGAKVIFVGKLDGWEMLKPGLTDTVRCISFPTYYGDTGFENWDTLTAQYAPAEGQPLCNLNDIMTIIYTSGTTGKPKGVVHTYKAISYATNMAFTVIDLKSQAHRFFSYLPLSHIAERMLVEMGCLYSGGQVYFAESLETFADNLRHAAPTVFLGVPRIWTKFQLNVLAKMSQKRLSLLLSIPLIGSFIRRSIQKKMGLHQAVYCLSGAAPIPASLVEWFGKLGIEVQEAYGMTENCAYSHFTRKGKIKLGSVGQSMPEVDVKLSEVGEILVKSEALMSGYYKNPELSAETFQDGYLRTGDKGTVSPEGYIVITGRVKELFKTEKGKYVAPAPIEMALAENTLIEQVCVTGNNLPQPIALAVLSADGGHKDKKDISENLEQWLKNVNSHLEAHERVKRIIILREPWTIENNLLTPTLKIKRDPIEQKYSASYEKWYKDANSVVWE